MKKSTNGKALNATTQKEASAIVSKVQKDMNTSQNKDVLNYIQDVLDDSTQSKNK